MLFILRKCKKSTSEWKKNNSIILEQIKHKGIRAKTLNSISGVENTCIGMLFLSTV